MTLLRTPDAARRVGVSVSYLEKLRQSGTGPAFVHLGRIVAYREGDLESWIASHVKRSTSEPAKGAAHG